VVDVEPTSAVPPPPPPPQSADEESPTAVSVSDDLACVQSPVNSSGVRIVIDSENNVDDDRQWPLPSTELDAVAAARQHLPDGPETETVAASGSASTGFGSPRTTGFR